MATNVMEGGLTVRGPLKADSISVPINSVGSEQFDGADPLAVDKQRHQYSQHVRQDHGTVTVDKRQVIHVARGNGTIRSFRIGQVVANSGGGTPTVTVTLLKNGANILNATLTLTTQAAFDTNDGTFTSATYLADDVFEVNVTVAAGGGTLGQGFFAQMVVDEEES